MQEYAEVRSVKIRVCKALSLTNVLQKAIFHVGDKVYLMSQGSREGMYLIASVAPGKCTLCHENGLPVRNGDEIAIEYLEAA